jgi:hypothetical protein
MTGYFVPRENILDTRLEIPITFSILKLRYRNFGVCLSSSYNLPKIQLNSFLKLPKIKSVKTIVILFSTHYSCIELINRIATRLFPSTKPVNYQQNI